MRVPQIAITSQVAQIGMNTIQPLQHIEQPQADMSISQPSADLKITQQPSKLTIDQTLAWKNLDLKSVFKRGDENAQKGFQKAMDYISKESREGDELMNIAKQENTIVKQAARALSHEIHFNTGNVPSSESVKIDYRPSSINIDVTKHEPNIKVQVNEPIHEYKQGSIDIYMRQDPSLKIEFNG